MNFMRKWNKAILMALMITIFMVAMALGLMGG